MTVKQNINLKSSNSLLLSPQLRQAIHLLQFSNQELSEFLNQQINENPLLEGECEILPTDDVEEYSNVSDSEVEVDDYYEQSDFNSLSSPILNKTNQSIDDSISSQLIQKKTLSSYLEEQLFENIHHHFEQKIGSYIIHSINDQGFLTIPYEEIAETFNTKKIIIEQIIQKMKSFDPHGIFSKTIEDSLRIELKDQSLLCEKMDIFLSNIHFLLKLPLKKISKICGISEKECQNFLLTIRTLSPYPSINFEHTPTLNIVPDVLINKKNGLWEIEINSETLPKIYIKKGYYQNLKLSLNRESDQKYLNDQYNHAKWLKKSVEHREKTLMKVAYEIMCSQEDFLQKGLSAIKPLILKNIAEKLNIHESTVSRITTSKYILTPYGTFPLKFFFSSSVASIYENHEAISTKHIHETIKKIINHENKKKPLSDDQMAKKLEEENIIVARRTINKYRKTLRIGSASERKHQYKLTLKA